MTLRYELDYAYQEAAEQSAPALGVVLSPAGAAAGAIISLTDTAAGRVFRAIRNQQELLAISMAAYEEDCK